ncbi:MAG: Eco57I restriction-modification methylase domain-containing protein [Magnetococcales bacterium]|nr:Eco57I restriction-modification methylase domain-containing protein [Magnetococcales bacterium]
MPKRAIAEFEIQRLALQDKLDAQIEPTKRNRMGQFATPTGLATDMLRYAKTQFCQSEKIRFIDPAIGTGAFYSALLKLFSNRHISAAIGYEIDHHYGAPAIKLWDKTRLEIRLVDFTQAEAPETSDKFNLVICNPPYVRHHHIDNHEKKRLKYRTQESCGVKINGLAGLYCYFLGLTHSWMSDGGLAGWLVPSEFMDVNYGVELKNYLLDKVTLLHIHRFNPNNVQFGDALVSSAVVWFRKAPPPNDHSVRFSYSGSLNNPKLERIVPIKTLRLDPKWTHYPLKKTYKAVEGPVLSDFFKIKRGLATGSNNYFILSANEIERRRLPMEAFKPILPSPRYLPDNEITADRDGNPLLKKSLFLLDCPWTENEIIKRYPMLWSYLEEGKALGVPEGYLCRHRKRWYMQEHRPPSPFVCTYLGRSNKKNKQQFRFILNNSKATAANVYLMLYPNKKTSKILAEDPNLKRKIWIYLNNICPQKMLEKGRVYGGGLYKLEPKELGNVPAEEITTLLLASAQQKKQANLFVEATA